MRRVVLVTGPPCAGKTTHVTRNAQPGDLVLDQDRIGQAAMRRALTQVAAMPDGTAWVIRCCPGPRARQQLAQQIRATERVHLAEPEALLVNRAAHRAHPRRHIAAVSSWFAKERADADPQPRGSSVKAGTTQRGYGWAHQRARAKALKDLADGQPCPRCGQPMWRSQARTLDLDHTDDRTGYQGLAHGRCNRRAGQAKAMRGRRARAAAVVAAQPARRSRNW